MKAYTVTEDQLENLGLVQLSTTLCFSITASLLTFWVSVRQDIAFEGKSTSGAQWWEGLATGALVVAVAIAILGVYLFYRGRTTIGRIKRETDHD